jgi:hypothetical protein
MHQQRLEAPGMGVQIFSALNPIVLFDADYLRLAKKKTLHDFESHHVFSIFRRMVRTTEEFAEVGYSTTICCLGFQRIHQAKVRSPMF